MRVQKLLPAAFKKNIVNALSWKNHRKIIIIESDDWGSIRMPSRKVYNILKKKGLVIDDHYNRYDCIATVQDLSALFEVLYLFRDHKGKNPAITANCLLGNPDFSRIREGNFERYFFEPFTDTLKKVSDCNQPFDLWQEGIDLGLFRPQFHGREHLNVYSWLAALRQRDRDALLSFEYGFWGHSIRDRNLRLRHYLAAYDYNSAGELDYVCSAATEGMEMFEKVFGYKSKSFIAPNFIWSPEVEKALNAQGATIIQGQTNQLISVPMSSTFQTKFHFTGQKNKLGQRYLIRNVFFEPSSDPAIDWVASCLNDIRMAFLWKTPAIISAHRVNFIGAIVPENRKNNLKLLKNLLKSIIKNWPDVEFMTSDQLSELMSNNSDK